MPAPIVARYGKSVIAARTAFVRHVAGVTRWNGRLVWKKRYYECRTAMWWWPCHISYWTLWGVTRKKCWISWCVLRQIRWKTGWCTSSGWKPGWLPYCIPYGETKQLHVHTHMIMSWGGIDNGNKIVVPEHDYVHIPLSARCSVTSLKMRWLDCSIRVGWSMISTTSWSLWFMGFIKRWRRKRTE